MLNKILTIEPIAKLINFYIKKRRSQTKTAKLLLIRIDSIFIWNQFHTNYSMLTGLTKNMQADGYEDVRKPPAVIPWCKKVCIKHTLEPIANDFKKRDCEADEVSRISINMTFAIGSIYY